MLREQFLKRLLFVLLLLIAALPGKAFAGHEIEGSFKGDGTHPSALPVRGETSAGFASKYVFRGTNLAPHSDGLIWGDGSVSVSPWGNGTFSFGFWAGSQLGTARFSTNAPGSSRTPREATDFTARDLTVPRLMFRGGHSMFLDTRKADREFLSDLFSDTLTVNRGLQLSDVFTYLERAYAHLATAQGTEFPLFYPFFRPPVFPVETVTGKRVTIYYKARHLGFSNDPERYWCVSLAGLFLAYATFTCWFFRDGLGPDSVTSSATLAWSRFWEDFRFAFLIGAPILLFGLWCILRRRTVLDSVHAVKSIIHGAPTALRNWGIWQKRLAAALIKSA